MIVSTRASRIGACPGLRASTFRNARPHPSRSLSTSIASSLSTSTQASSPTCPQAYVSLSTNPWFNLAFEDHLFRTVDPAIPVCFLYRNSPCVVVGRNQNPWKELNASAMRSIGLPMVRRRSGGGTVYHDLGNTNYSFHIPREAFDRRTHAELVARALNAAPVALHRSRTDLARADVGAYVNGRNDICIRVRSGFDRSATPKTKSEADERGFEERKVSGSAYKLVNRRAYHHGTMLLSASLGSLGSSLKNDRGELLVTKGVASVPAPVANLTDAFPDRKTMLSHETFVHAVVAEFHRTYPHSHTPNAVEVDESSLSKSELNQGRWQLRENFDELQSWPWVFGQTPEFTHRVSLHDASELGTHDQHGWGPFSVEMHSKEGIVLNAKLVEARFDDARVESEVRRVVMGLQGKRYDELALPPPWGPSSPSTASVEVTESVEGTLLHWLRTVL
ncbi:related to lipoyltransferase [Sporisorium reilianum f. sp. reilianum]|uniref:Putative lipoate-protein ligase A n=1 Tax=Sporisorium reilianum f. sp. reilianum TaxID=72559 RepID=A0A2N8UG16_9BASI|nr:related to lipoyltransferase [Sporisorium reilianum f. sp. reilianum]